MRALFLAAVVVALSACGSATTATPKPSFRAITVSLPANIAGFAVQSEPKTASKLNTGDPHTLLDGGAVYSLRQNGELDAVLEVAQLKPSVNGGDLSFQQSVVGQIGESVPRPVRVQKQTVYEATAADKQSVFTWFHAQRMYVLLTHDVSDPKPLLQGLLQVTT
jgi:hypothetical protein